MKHRTFGRSGIKVTEVIFGAGAVGGILIHQDDATKREAVRRAIAGGINWIDTAAQYGNGKSEEALGWLLPEAGATPYLSTKFGLDRLFRECGYGDCRQPDNNQKDCFRHLPRSLVWTLVYRLHG